MTTSQFLLSAWRWNPAAVFLCGAALLAYGRRAGFGRARRSGYFVAAVVLFYLTVASPLSVLADGLLFSAHMLQHLLLLLVVPALLLLGWPPLATPAAGGLRLHPFAAWCAGLSAMWIWHERTLCDAAATNPMVQACQVGSLLALGSMFWWPIMGPQRPRRLPALLGVAYLFSACVGCTILGILITFAPVGVVCPAFMHPTDRLGILSLIRQDWGISPAIDQQAGGLIMWVPACGVYLSGVVALLVRWYRGSEVSETPSGFAARPATGGSA